MPKQKEFVEGMKANRPREGAPEFVKAEVSFKVDEVIAWLRENANPAGWVNVQIKEGRSGSWYAEKNGFKKTPEVERRPQPEIDEDDVASSIPF